MGRYVGIIVDNILPWEGRRELMYGRIKRRRNHLKRLRKNLWRRVVFNVLIGGWMARQLLVVDWMMVLFVFLACETMKLFVDIILSIILGSVSIYCSFCTNFALPRASFHSIRAITA